MRIYFDYPLATEENIKAVQNAIKEGKDIGELLDFLMKRRFGTVLLFFLAIRTQLGLPYPEANPRQIIELLKNGAVRQ